MPSQFSFVSSNLVERLLVHSQNQPDKTAYIFLKDGETEIESLTYRQLDQQARGIAAHLESGQGKRALLLYHSGLEFIAGFFGCLYAGVIAVPVYPPRQNQNLSRLHSIVEDAQADYALTTASILTNIHKRFAENLGLAQLNWLITDSLGAEENFVPKSVTSETLAFLQYTSGSTGTPKGAMVTHSCLMHNLEMICQAFGHSEKSIGVGWLPLFHDLGLIGHILQPIYVGFPSVIMPPVAFLQKPIRWLKAISQYRATTSGGPNFAYDLCVQKIKLTDLEGLDLSSWDLAYNGAESVSAKTLATFAQKFSVCGFRRSAFFPCYGMAEATLLITGGIKSEEPVIQVVDSEALKDNRIVVTDNTEGQKLVACGQPWLDTKVVIAQPQSLTALGEGEVGEIWVSGSNLTSGYWQKPQQTQDTFNAYLADRKEGHFFRTGDLGFLLNGELFITGRLKDVIIIRGRNHYPQDIELTVEQSHIALRNYCSAAFSVDKKGEESLIVVCEIERIYLRKLNTDEVVQKIKIAIATEHQLEVAAIILLKTGTIPKTSSGKIQRNACKIGFLANTLDVVFSWEKTGEKISDHHSNIEKINSQNLASSKPLKNRIEIENWLIQQIAQKLHLPPENIDKQQPLAALGLDSLQAVEISSELQEWLGGSLSPTIIYDYPTVTSLANYLAKNSAELLNNDDNLSSLAKNNEAIAIVGLGCRFPGAENPQEFWNLLKNGVNSVTQISDSRWEITQKFGDKILGKQNYYGGFLSQVDGFDCQFFNISPREAANIDPQQRLLLEVSWEALENAGLAPQRLAGIRGGVFIGISSGDYARLSENLTNTEAYYGTGNALSIAANRLSYFLDWHGPSWAVDTACSSSLVAVHQACQSLLQGECNLALAGGVNLILSPQLTLTFSEAQMMAADGRCKTFDAEADGYVRGEGCGVVVLKRLADAIADGDNIQAVIRGSAVNQDGLTNGLTAPNGNSQQEVIRLALAKARVKPNQISYVETHGTGTVLGDPIEVNSLKAVLMTDRNSEQICHIGAVKTNIGHLEAASGIASLIKVVLSLQNQKIPAHLHLKNLNPYIEIANTPIVISREIQPWHTTEKLKLAGVSSFGFGGTNAHIILEEAPPVKTADTSQKQLHLLTLSAKTEKAMADLVSLYQNYLVTESDVELADICLTANSGRSHFNYRLAIITSDKEDLNNKLAKITAKQELLNVFSGQISSNHKSPKIAFLFTGQGSQYVNMGKELYQTQPVFRQTFDQCEQILQSYLEKSLLEILYPENTQEFDHHLLTQTAYTQPALFAFEYSLFKLWQSWGIEPNIVMGHSLGEYVAACVAGVFSLEDGLKLVANRGRLMQQLPTDGKMVAAIASEDQINKLIAPYLDQVSLAAINGRENVVISGKSETIANIISNLESAGIETKPLQVSHAFHSPLMNPILKELEILANQVAYFQPTIPIISNVTGTIADEHISTANYWVNHTCEPVRFAQSINVLNQLGYEIFLEIGPKPVLLTMGRECLLGTKKIWLPSIRPNKDNWLQMLESLVQLYLLGVEIDWLGFYRNYLGQKVILPTYPWQRQRYWISDIQERKHKISQVSKPQELPEVSEQKILQPLKRTLLNPHSVSVPQTRFPEPRQQRKLTPLMTQSIQTPSISPENPAQIAGEINSPSKILDLDIAQIQATLKQQLADVLYIDVKEIKLEQKFIDLGLDSITGVEWISFINKTYGVSIKATKLYDYPTILELTDYLIQEISSTEGKSITTENQPEPTQSLNNHNSSDDVSGDFKTQLRLILNQVKNHELTIQAANQMIQTLKQKI